MKHKCIEPTKTCPLQRKYGNGLYCALPHAPNHKWVDDGGVIKQTKECSEDIC